MSKGIRDFVYSSAVAGHTEKLGVIYSSVADAQKDTFIQHQKIVFLPNTDRTEIQRAASNKIACMISISSLQNAFDLVKQSGVTYVHVNMNGPPLIDFAWMSLAKENKIGVVFSLADIQLAFYGKNVNALQEFRKAARLLEKAHVSLYIASLAKESFEVLSKTESHALLKYLGTKNPEKMNEGEM
ncbi:MAG: hypothetical protein AABX02_03340 [archaeon]